MILMAAFMSLQSITGIQPEPVFADFSDAKQKIRAGMPMGAQVELIGASMYEFLDKMIQIVLPRMREFQGYNPVTSGKGIVKIQLPETAMGYFPDIEPVFDMYPRLFETEVTIETTGQSEKETILLLSGFQLPFLEQKVIEQIKEVTEHDPWAKFKKAKEERFYKK